MSANATVTASDFWSSLRGAVRLVYDEVVPVSVISLGTSLLLFPLVTIGPACLAAVVTMSEIAHRRGSASGRSERERLRSFPSAIRRYFRAGIPFSVLIVFTALNLVTYVLLASANDSAVFWFGAALALYTLIIVVALTFRAGSLLADAGADTDELPGTRALLAQGVDVWLQSPWYSAIHLLVVAFILLVMVLLTPAAMVLLAGSLAALEVVVYEDLAGDGAATFFEENDS
ncbi:hypothetical protein SAMN06269185_0007 [Natronoarchaeum philippinense]|uniref:DUF624 domain-containing protein n=1 Tax=Natronoarchaeum philippinense TaxID=558529 RepID=A0A285MZ54_NATPI|nr:hypothetical protein [Natronoarchaeum philippinense]SNZ02378.1 hypothetical protein SAMN06269185_0007 [Natronoarchaeum philippinense]